MYYLKPSKNKNTQILCIFLKKEKRERVMDSQHKDTKSTQSQDSGEEGERNKEEEEDEEEEEDDEDEIAYVQIDIGATDPFVIPSLIQRMKVKRKINRYMIDQYFFDPRYVDYFLDVLWDKKQTVDVKRASDDASYIPIDHASRATLLKMAFPEMHPKNRSKQFSLWCVYNFDVDDFIDALGDLHGCCLHLCIMMDNQHRTLYFD